MRGNYHFDKAVRHKINKYKVLLSGIDRLRQKSERKRSVGVSDYFIGLN